MSRITLLLCLLGFIAFPYVYSQCKTLGSITFPSRCGPQANTSFIVEKVCNANEQVLFKPKVLTACTSCCQQHCKCYGDPHCVSFQRKKADITSGSSKNPTSLLLYRYNTFSVTIRIGDQGVILSVGVTGNNGTKEVLIDAKTCESNPQFYKPLLAAEGIGRFSNTSKQPGSSKVQPVFGNQMKFTHTSSEVQVTLLCLSYMAGKKKLYRLNVEDIYEPRFGMGGEGFCVNGQVGSAISLATKPPPTITSAADLEISNVLEECKNLTNGATKVTLCKERFCQREASCLTNLQFMGWASLWCIKNTLGSGNPADCSQFTPCQECLDNVDDFGFSSMYASFVYDTVDPGCNDQLVFTNAMGVTQTWEFADGVHFDIPPQPLTLSDTNNFVKVSRRACQRSNSCLPVSGVDVEFSCLPRI